MEGYTGSWWELGSVLTTFYPDFEKQKAKEKFAAGQSGIEEWHEELFPGIPLPKVLDCHTAATCGDSFRKYLATSHLAAFATWAVTNLKRSSRSRAVAATFFCSFIKLACEMEMGLQVTFPAFRADHSSTQMSVTVGADGQLGCWTDSMFHEVAFWWDQDVLDPTRSFPKSPRSATTLWDFILWGLEPIPLKVRDKNLHALKGLLCSTAGCMVKSLVSHYDDTLAPFFRQLEEESLDSEALEENNRKRRKRVGKSTELEVAADAAMAAQLLFSGKDAQQCIWE